MIGDPAGLVFIAIGLAYVAMTLIVHPIARALRRLP